VESHPCAKSAQGWGTRLISHYGKIIRMDSTTIRESGRNAQGVRLLNMEPGDKVAAAVVIAPEEEPNGNGGTLIQ